MTDPDQYPAVPPPPMPPLSWLAKAMRAFLRWLLGRLFVFELSGLERLPRGGYIIAANHPAWVEPFALVAFLPVERGLRLLASQAVTADIAWRRWLLNLADVIVPVDASGRRIGAAMRTAIGQLKGGAAVGIFPEPPARPGDSYDRVRPLRRGVAYLARSSGCPVVPIGVPDTRELWLGRRLRINVGEPLPPPLERDGEEAFLATLRARIEALFPPLDQPPPVRRWTWLSKLFSDAEETR